MSHLGALDISMLHSCDLNIQRDFLTSGRRSSRKFPVTVSLIGNLQTSEVKQVV